MVLKKSKLTSSKITFGTLWESVRTQKHDFIRANVFGAVNVALLLPIPILIPMLIDEILLGHPGKITAFATLLGLKEAWQIIAGTLFVVLLLRGIAFLLGNAKTLHALRIAQKSAYTLRHTILHHLERIAISDYETIKSGAVASKTINDVENIGRFLGMATTTTLTAGLAFVGVLGVLFYISWPLALLVVIANPLFLGFSHIVGRRAGALLRKQNEAYDAYQDLMSETMELFTQVRASNQERTFFGLLRIKAANIQYASLEYGYKSSVARSSSALLTMTAVDIFQALGIVTVAYTQLSVGMMLAFLFYLATIAAPVTQLMGLVISFQSVRPSITRLNQLLNTAHEPHYPHENNPFTSVNTASVEINNVSFAYADGKPVLDNICIKIEQGEKVALIGPSGSGKTTIAQLLVGFYVPGGGSIGYGGVPIEMIGLPIVRENVALMLQQSLFFNDTIRMNLALGKEIDDTKIFDALRQAQLDGFVKELDRGLETLIGKNGIRLSGGQRQRLAIARLILSDPKVVIFDEATSALDEATEHRLYDTLREFLSGRTTIIIAHRETTIRQADRIYLIEDGVARAVGDYEQTAERGFIQNEK